MTGILYDETNVHLLHELEASRYVFGARSIDAVCNEISQRAPFAGRQKWATGAVLESRRHEG
jgi:hypothetical protein